MSVLDNLPQVDPNDFSEEWMNAPIDHYNYQDHRAYKQRYFKNDKYFDKENGPVFVNICGEYTCSVRPDRLFPFMLGAKHNALLIAIEHRFYGKSQPFEDWATENFQYLSAEQALSDLAHFLININKDKPSREVVIIGGSYPGALAAWFRERYPHLSVASWASSGVVYPLADMWKFDE